MGDYYNDKEIGKHVTLKVNGEVKKMVQGNNIMIVEYAMKVIL